MTRPFEELSRETKENYKFDEDEDGNVLVRTSAKGEFSPTGLKNGGRITEVQLNSSGWTPLPLTALTDRNAMAIQNRSGIEIKLNYDSGVSGYIGVTVDSGGERFYDITDSIIIYAKSVTGTPTVTIEEIS